MRPGCELKARAAAPAAFSFSAFRQTCAAPPPRPSPFAFSLLSISHFVTLSPSKLVHELVSLPASLPLCLLSLSPPRSFPATTRPGIYSFRVPKAPACPFAMACFVHLSGEGEVVRRYKLAMRAHNEVI